MHDQYNSGLNDFCFKKKQLLWEAQVIKEIMSFEFLQRGQVH